eukprot:IDg4405t1
MARGAATLRSHFESVVIFLQQIEYPFRSETKMWCIGRCDAVRHQTWYCRRSGSTGTVESGADRSALERVAERCRRRSNVPAVRGSDCKSTQRGYRLAQRES